MSDNPPTLQECVDNLVAILRDAVQTEIIEPALQDRARAWFEIAQQEFPQYAKAMRSLARGSPETVLNMIVRNRPGLSFLQDNQNALELIRAIQTGRRQ